MLRPGSVAAVHLAAALQFAMLVGTSVTAVVLGSFFDLFGRTPPVAWFWHLAPGLGGYTARPAIAGVVFLLVPLLLVLYRYRIGRPALVVGEVFVCVPAVGFASTAAHVPAGSIIVAFIVGFVVLGLLCITMLLRAGTDEWLTKSIR